MLAAPVWFLLVIAVTAFLFVGQGIPERGLPEKLTEFMPTILLCVQILLLGTLLVTTRKEKFSIFHNGWSYDTQALRTDILGGVLTGIALALLYFSVLAPLQTYVQRTIGDYVPAGETMRALGNQTLPFFIANVLFAPFVEESLYRNYALTRFSEHYGLAKSIFLTTIMFALLHWVGGLWYVVMTGLFVGLPFGLIAAKKKNILWVFVAHCTLNLLEFIYILTTT